MTFLKKTFIILIAFIALFTVGLYATGHAYIFTAIQRTYLAGHATANINDHTVFNTHKIETTEPSPLALHTNHIGGVPAKLKTELENDGAIAFLVLKDGQVIVEDYFKGYNKRSKTNSFSMAKTVLTMMVGIAIERGYINSLDQKLTDFLPEFDSDPLAAEATIGHLSWMNSGYDWTEHYYTPFSPTVELLYGDDVRSFLLGREFSTDPGEFWEYSSASTQLLGIALLRAMRKAGNTDTLSEFLSEALWQPMQMNDSALWHTDNNNMEHVYCCINTNARNFSKLGQLMLDQGKWNGKQLVSSEFINKMITPTNTEVYGLSTWLGMHKAPAHFVFSGHLGQYIIVVPEHNMVVVRLGEKSPPGGFLETSVPSFIETALQLIK